MADLQAQLQTGLAGQYTLERELGRGGMATVFLAQDVKHKRPVALKVLHPEIAASLGPERFEREIEIAARLQHPHILTVHDSGETAGQLWFTMPYVEGESLRDRLRRERQLAVEDAVRITREAAQALQYAHEHGVVHRDIKPENLLLTRDGNTLVADFGIARALGGEERLTQTGMAIGTPAYMSPEQASGEKTIDARTDVYSLGAVLYEMLAGEPPYTGPTAQAIILKRFTEPVPSVRKSRPSVPEAVEQAVQKALAPVPADRFATAAQFAQALQPMVTAATTTPTAVATPAISPTSLGSPTSPPVTPARRLPVAAITLGLGFLIGLGVLFAWRRTHAGASESAGPKVLAVLPFKNLGAPEDQYFADGLTEEITSRLANIASLGVISRTSADQYRNTPKTLRQIGQELGAGYLLEGSVRWEKAPGGKSRIRVTPQLIQVADDRHLWADRYDADLADVFQIQGQIAEQVTSALNVALGEPERRALSVKPTSNLGAYDLYLQGNQAAAGFDQVAPLELRRAIGFYERSVALDSTFALAWAQLSRAYSLLNFTGLASTQMAQQARAAAARALAIDPSLAAGRLALADYYNYVRQDWKRALDEYAVARKAAPNNADILKGAAIVARSQGQWVQSQALFKEAQALDPRSIATARRLAITQLWLRQYPEALDAAEKALAIDPRAPDLHQVKVMVSLAQGDLAGARAAIKAAESQVEQTAFVAWMATYWDLYWVLDDKQQALLLRLLPGPFDDNRAIWGLAIAAPYALRGDQARARAYAESSRVAFEEQLKDAPEDPTVSIGLATALAYLGRKAEAVREGERGLALLPVSRDAYSGAYNQHQLARIYLLVGEPEKALDQLEPLLKTPYYLSPGWLRIDPTFAPLRGNPRFEKLVAGR